MYLSNLCGILSFGLIFIVLLIWLVFSFNYCFINACVSFSYDFWIPYINPNLHFMNCKCDWQKNKKQTWLSNKKIYRLNDCWTYFQTTQIFFSEKMVGRNILRKEVLLMDIKKHNSFSHCTCYIVSAVPKRCRKNKFIGYILGTWIFENSINFKNLKSSL